MATKKPAKPKAKQPAKPKAKQPAKAKAKPATNPGLLSPLQAKAAAQEAVGPAAIPAQAAEATPRKLADERRRLEMRRKRERQNRIKVYEKADKALVENRTKVLAQAESGGPAVALAAAAAVPPLRILAEGDSWFDYPNFLGAGVIFQLEQKMNALFLNLATAGDEARFMLGVDERKVLSEQLKSAVDRGRPFDALLFSGGGNDIVGIPLILWLKTFVVGMTAKDVIDPGRFAAALGLVRAAFEDLILIRDQNSPNTKIFLNAYDLAIPDGRGVCGFGPWLQPSLKARGVSPDLRREVVKELLSQFAAMLAVLADPARKVFLVPTQGTFAGHDELWANELHPTVLGFRAIADKFKAALKAEFPGRV